MELFNVGSTEGVELHVFDENGVERSDDVLKKGFRRVENLHGVTYKGRKGLGWEVFEMNGRRDLYEIQDESPIPLAPEYHHTASSDTSSFSLDGSPPLGERHTELQTIQTYLTTLRTDLTTLQRDFMDYTNVMAEQMDHFSSLLPPVTNTMNTAKSQSFGLYAVEFSSWEVLDGYVKSFESYKTSVESFLCTLVPETSSLHIEYTPGGLIYRPGGSNLQHATSITFLGLVYANYLSHTSHTINYGNVQVSAQSLRKRDNIKVDNILGDNLLGLSYMVGYSNNYPQRIHQHISSLPSVNDHSQNIERHCHTMTTMKGQFTSTQQILNVHVGAIVGGLEEDDVYVDDRAPFVGV
ncbi:endoglucanase 23 [Lathyrus oleraceus]|uniref:endoglucanase 23 n=1 Tax=Pisum sativum TaxID=3888 RepID=UPI0021CF4287|nr:endoglucanase 23-like [Pisum sativum]